MDHLKNFQQKLPSNSVFQLGDEVVEKYANQFKRDCKAGGSVNYAYGFFESEFLKDIRLFLEQTGAEAVRYYFGFSEEKSYVLNDKK